MPGAEVLARLGGLFAVPALLGADECQDLCAEMARARQEAATVRDSSGTFVVDEESRRVKWVRVSSDAVSRVSDRLHGLVPDVARHYGVSVSGVQVPQFLAYGPGDFYRPHRDNSPERDASDVSHARQISAVLFLNETAADPKPGGYGGGALTFYGLLDDPRTKDLGLALDATAGLLMTFRADTVHGVSPVTHGFRYTAVSWFTV